LEVSLLPELRLICFDWGDTVMRVIPGQTGPMAAWPRVEVMPGALQALRALAPCYRLVLLTTGGQSSESEVRTALRRGGLEKFFRDIILSRELGLAKSDPEFYRRAMAALGCAPEQALMVGDSYENDVRPAKRAGLRAVWYLAGGRRCLPPETPPEEKPDAVIGELSELPRLLEDRSTAGTGRTEKL